MCLKHLNFVPMDKTTNEEPSSRRRSERLGKKHHHSYESFLVHLDDDEEEDENYVEETTSRGRKSLKRKSSLAKVQGLSTSLQSEEEGCQSGSKGEKTQRHNSSEDSDRDRVMVPTGEKFSVLFCDCAASVPDSTRVHWSSTFLRAN